MNSEDEDEYEDMTWEEFFSLSKQGWKNFELHNEEIRRREERLNNIKKVIE